MTYLLWPYVMHDFAGGLLNVALNCVAIVFYSSFFLDFHVHEQSLDLNCSIPPHWILVIIVEYATLILFRNPVTPLMKFRGNLIERGPQVLHCAIIDRTHHCSRSTLE